MISNISSESTSDSIDIQRSSSRVVKSAEGLLLEVGGNVFFVAKDGIIRQGFILSIHNEEEKVTVRLSEKCWSNYRIDETKSVSEIFVDVSNLKIPKRDKSSKNAPVVSVMAKKPQKQPKQFIANQVSEPVKEKKLTVKIVTPDKKVLSTSDIENDTLPVPDKNIENDKQAASKLNDKIMNKLERDYTVVKENSGIYAGPLNKKGEREGKGLLTYAKTSDDQTRNQWYGYFEKNQINGKGILTFHDGKVFRGIAKNGKIKYGTMRYPKQDKFGRMLYKGCFGSDGKQGYGRLKTEFGDILEGTWENGKLNGSGRIAFNANSDRKEFYGEFLNSEMSKGKLTYRDGRVYEGEFEGNLPSGLGTIKLSNQASPTSGLWLNGYMISLSINEK